MFQIWIFQRILCTTDALDKAGFVYAGLVSAFGQNDDFFESHCYVTNNEGHDVTKEAVQSAKENSDSLVGV